MRDDEGRETHSLERNAFGDERIRIKTTKGLLLIKFSVNVAKEHRLAHSYNIIYNIYTIYMRVIIKYTCYHSGEILLGEEGYSVCSKVGQNNSFTQQYFCFLFFATYKKY